FFQAEDGIRDRTVTGVQTCALPICARILPTFAESLSRKATKRLTKLGVEVSTGVKVEKVDGQGVIAAGNRIPSATVLWTAGVSRSEERRVGKEWRSRWGAADVSEEA